MYVTKFDITGELPEPLRIEAELMEHDVALVAGRGIANALKAHFLGLNESRHGGFSIVGFYEQAADQVYGSSDGEPANDYGDAIGVGTTKVGMILRRYGTSILPGGFLLPKERMYLAIPNHEFLGVTHGKSPLEFANLRVVFGRQEGGVIGPIGLAAGSGGAREKDESRGGGDEYQEEGWDDEGKPVRMRFSRKLSKEERSSLLADLKEAGHNLKPGLEDEVLFWLKKKVFQAEDETVLPGDEQLLAAGAAAVVGYLEGLPPAIKRLN